MTYRPKSIVIVSQFYAPEPCAAAHRVQALAQALASRGDRVHVIAPHPSFPLGIIDPAYRSKFIVRERESVPSVPLSKDPSDIHITRIHHIASAKRGGRILAWGSFALLASFAVATLPYKPDVIIISSPPISVGFPGIVGRLLRGAKLVVDVRDVFPDLIIQAGIWKERGLMATLVGGFARLLYRQSSFVAVVTPTACERVLHRAPCTKVEIFPNAADTVTPARGVIPNVILSEVEGGGTGETRNFIVTFAGNMGLANGMDVILDAAKILKTASLDQSPVEDQYLASKVRFVLIGGGADYERVAKRAKEEQLINVSLLGVLPRASAVGALVESDVSLVNLRDGVQESIPTKIFDAFAVGCPVILSADGEAKKIINASQGGIAIKSGDPNAIVDAICRLQKDPSLRETLAANGQRFVRENYDRTKIMTAYAETIENL